MTATNHAVTGILVAVAIKQPALALPAAFLSHFIIDTIPHWDHKFKNHHYTQVSIIIDLALASLLTLILMITLNAPVYLILLGSFFGAVPDITWIKEFKTPVLNREVGKSLWQKANWFFHWIQWSETRNAVVVEVIWLMITLTILFKNYT